MANPLETTEVAEGDSQKSVPVNEAHDQLADAANDIASKALDDDGTTDMDDSAGKLVLLRNQFVKFTGSLSQDEDVLVPVNIRSLWVRDDSTGGFDVTVKTTSGTGIILRSGSWTLISVDGTNVTEILEVSAPRDFRSWTPGALSSSQIVYRFPSSKAFIVPDDFLGAQANVKTAPTGGALVLSFTKNGASAFGTMTFDNNSNDVDTLSATEESFAIGDILEVTVTTINGSPADLSFEVPSA